MAFYPRPVGEDLLDAERRTDEPVYVDFDYTLFACNSTELFIASCKPGVVAGIVEFGIRRCLPWRLLRRPGVPRFRDYSCCLALAALTPWNLARWRRIAPSLFERHASPAIRHAARGIGTDRLSIISFGMAFIIRPLLDGSEFRSVRVVATPVLASPRYFAQRKRDILAGVIGADAVAGTTFITDSLDDADLLAAAGRGILIDPQGAPFLAVEHLYLPLRYTARGKYTRSYVLDQLLLVEFLLLALSVSTGWSVFLRMLVPTGALFLSVMCVYEIGYFENDMRAARSEARPRITAAVDRFRAYPMQPAAWIWSGALAGIAGATLFATGTIGSTAQLASAALFWGGALVTVRLVFAVYNGANLSRRVTLYPVLQALKFAPVLLLIPPTTLGAVAIACQIGAMWAIYVTYRLDGRAKDFPREKFRVALLAIAGALLSLAPGAWRESFAFQIGALSLWCVARLCKAPLLRALRRRRES